MSSEQNKRLYSKNWSDKNFEFKSLKEVMPQFTISQDSIPTKFLHWIFNTIMWGADEICMDTLDLKNDRKDGSYPEVNMVAAKMCLTTLTIFFNLNKTLHGSDRRNFAWNLRTVSRIS